MYVEIIIKIKIPDYWVLGFNLWAWQTWWRLRGRGLEGWGEGDGALGGGGSRLNDNLIDCKKALCHSKGLCEVGMFQLRSWLSNITFQILNCERDTLGGGEGGGGLGGGGEGGGGLGGGGEGGGGRGGGGPRLIDNLIDCKKALHYFARLM